MPRCWSSNPSSASSPRRFAQRLANGGTCRRVLLGQPDRYSRPAVIGRKYVADDHAVSEQGGRKFSVRLSGLEEDEVAGGRREIQFEIAEQLEPLIALLGDESRDPGDIVWILQTCGGG